MEKFITKDRCLLRGNNSLEDLCEYVAVNWTGAVEVATQLVASELQGMASHFGWEVPEIFTIQTPNSPAALIHWRVLSFLMERLTLDQRNQFREIGQMGQGPARATQATAPSTVPYLPPQDQAEVASSLEGPTLMEVSQASSDDIPPLIDWLRKASRWKQGLLWI